MNPIYVLFISTQGAVLSAKQAKQLKKKRKRKRKPNDYGDALTLDGDGSRRPLSAAGTRSSSEYWTLTPPRTRPGTSSSPGPSTRTPASVFAPYGRRHITCRNPRSTNDSLKRDTPAHVNTELTRPIKGREARHETNYYSSFIFIVAARHAIEVRTLLADKTEERATCRRAYDSLLSHAGTQKILTSVLLRDKPLPSFSH